MNDRRDHPEREFLTGKSFQDLRFGQIRIVEDHREHLRMTFRQQRACNATGTASRERDLLTQRNLRKAHEQLFFGVALQFRRDGGRKRQLNEIHQIEVTNQPESSQARSAGMKTKSALDPIAFEERLALARFFENFAGKIFSFQQQTKLRFVERGIVEQRQEHVCGRMMQKRGQLIAGGDARAFAILGHRFGGDKLGHELTFRDFERARQGVAREHRCRFGNWPRERAGTGVVDHLPKQKVELFT